MQPSVIKETRFETLKKGNNCQRNLNLNAKFYINMKERDICPFKAVENFTQLKRSNNSPNINCSKVIYKNLNSQAQ